MGTTMGIPAILNPIPYQMPMGVSDYGKRIRFNRINEVIEINGCDRSKLEPLDELRIKVADWLNN